MASNTDLLFPTVPMEKFHEKHKIKSPWLKMATDPLLWAGLATGGIAGAFSAKKFGNKLLMSKSVRKNVLEDVSEDVLQALKTTGKVPEGFEGQRVLSAANAMPGVAAVTKPGIKASPEWLGRQFLKRTGKGHQLDLVYSGDTPYFDWDLGVNEKAVRGNTGKLAHANMGVEGKDDVVENLGHVFDLLAERSAKLKESGVPSRTAVYMTPGGYRGAELAHAGPPSVGFSDELRPSNVDPMHAKLSQGKKLLFGNQRDVPVGVINEAYPIRTSVKPGRSLNKDYIAAKVAEVGRGIPLTESMLEVIKTHDTPIASQAIKRPKLMESILDDVAREMKSLTPRERDLVRKMLLQQYPGMSSLSMP